MEYFRILVRELTRNFMKIANPENVIEVTRLNAYLSTVYKILLWENPVFTWILLAVLHIFLWIIVQFHFRLYGIAFLTILMGLVVDFYFERIGLQAVRNEKSEAIKDIFTILFNVFVYLKVLRKDNPPVVPIFTFSIVQHIILHACRKHTNSECECMRCNENIGRNRRQI